MNTIEFNSSYFCTYRHSSINRSCFLLFFLLIVDASAHHFTTFCSSLLRAVAPLIIKWYRDAHLYHPPIKFHTCSV
jgi:hypothetical protein